MKRWISLVLSLLVLSACVIGVMAVEGGSHTVQTKVIGEGTVIPDVTTVAHGNDLRLYFYPEDGYEVTAIFLNGYPVTYALSLRSHETDCKGCDSCDWIDWDLLAALVAGDDWSEWKLYVDLCEVAADKLLVVEFSPVKAEKEPVSKLQQYSDLDASAWYADAVNYVLDTGLMNGVGGGKFDPNGNTTRAQIVAMLWRLEGSPAVKYDMKFDDVAAGKWYTDAVCWAASEQIVGGSNGKFAPNDPVTREQLAAILWRYAKYKNYDVSVGENTNILSYDDAFEISSWAYAPLQWACGAGLMKGSGTKLMPHGHASRIQTAAVLYRLQEK